MRKTIKDVISEVNLPDLKGAPKDVSHANPIRCRWIEEAIIDLYMIKKMYYEGDRIISERDIYYGLTIAVKILTEQDTAKYWIDYKVNLFQEILAGARVMHRQDAQAHQYNREEGARC